MKKYAIDRLMTVVLAPVVSEKSTDRKSVV